MENKVKCYSYDELNKDLLKQFSEGSIALENLLNYCYKNKIETKACCIGHKEDKGQSKPYICLIIPEEQEYIMENIINNLFSQGDFSNHVQVEIDKENNNSKVAIRFDYLEEELRDTFFTLIQKTIANVIVNGKNNPGIYDELLDTYKKINTENNIELTITSAGISVIEAKDTYLKLADNKLIEVPKEEADIFSSYILK